MTTPNLDELAERRLLYTDIERRDRVVPITAAERDWLVVQARALATVTRERDALREELSDLRRVGTRGGWS